MFWYHKKIIKCITKEQKQYLLSDYLQSLKWHKCFILWAFFDSMATFTILTSLIFHWRQRPCLTVCSTLNAIGLFSLAVCCAKCALLRYRLD